MYEEWGKDDDHPHDGGSDCCQEDSASRHILRATNDRVVFGMKRIRYQFDRAVGGLHRPDQSRRDYQKTGLDPVEFQPQAKHDHQQRRDEMDPRIGLMADHVPQIPAAAKEKLRRILLTG